MSYKSVTELTADNPNLAEYISELEKWKESATEALDDAASLIEGMRDGAPDANPSHKMACNVYERIQELIQ